MPEGFKRPSPEELVRNAILFDLLVKAGGKDHWKSPFEIKIRLGSEHDSPVPKSVVHPWMRDMAEAISWYHGAAIVLDVTEIDKGQVTSRPAPRGEPAAYALFDGYVLTVGSTGYQG